MKLLKTVVTAVALCAAFVAQARTLDEVKKDGKIIVATEGQFAPFNYFKGTQLTGFEVEVAELVVKKMGLKLEWKTLGFDALLTGLAQNRWDVVIASHGVTEERAKAVTFANPHYCSGGMIVAMDAKIRTAADLTGKVVAVQTGTSYLTNVQKLAGVKEVKNFPQDTDAQRALISKRVDAWVSDKLPSNFLNVGFIARALPAARIVHVRRREAPALGDRVAAGERGAHPLVPHGDAIRDGDRGEFARRAERLLHAELHRLRLPVQRDVAGRGLVPAGGDADQRLMNFSLRDPHRIEIAAVRRALRPGGGVARNELRFAVDFVGHKTA